MVLEQAPSVLEKVSLNENDAHWQFPLSTYARFQHVPLKYPSIIPAFYLLARNHLFEYYQPIQWLNEDRQWFQLLSSALCQHCTSKGAAILVLSK
jgi:hypothetical protein